MRPPPASRQVTQALTAAVDAVSVAIGARRENTEEEVRDAKEAFEVRRGKFGEQKIKLTEARRALAEKRALSSLAPSEVKSFELNVETAEGEEEEAKADFEQARDEYERTVMEGAEWRVKLEQVAWSTQRH